MNIFNPTDNYFSILGLLFQAPEEAVTRAYKRLVISCHPDKNLNPPPGFEQRFQQINTAYKLLKEYRDFIDLEEEARRVQEEQQQHVLLQ